MFVVLTLNVVFVVFYLLYFQTISTATNSTAVSVSNNANTIANPGIRNVQGESWNDGRVDTSNWGISLPAVLNINNHNKYNNNPLKALAKFYNSFFLVTLSVFSLCNINLNFTIRKVKYFGNNR